MIYINSLYTAAVRYSQLPSDYWHSKQNSTIKSTTARYTFTAYSTKTTPFTVPCIQTEVYLSCPLIISKIRSGLMPPGLFAETTSASLLLTGQQLVLRPGCYSCLITRGQHVDWARLWNVLRIVNCSSFYWGQLPCSGERTARPLYIKAAILKSTGVLISP